MSLTSCACEYSPYIIWPLFPQVGFEEGDLYCGGMNLHSLYGQQYILIHVLWLVFELI